VIIRNFTNITNPVRSAITIANGSSATIEGNLNITGAGLHGVAVFRSSHARIENNTITGGSAIDADIGHGVIVSYSSHADIFSNTIINSRSFGVYSLMSSSVRVDDNTITGNRRGIVLARSGTARLSGARGFKQPNTLDNIEREVSCSGFSALRVDTEVVPENRTGS